jgi:hypothetical protein
MAMTPGSIGGQFLITWQKYSTKLCKINDPQKTHFYILHFIAFEGSAQAKTLMRHNSESVRCTS